MKGLGSRSAFTMIELLMVIVIIAILGATAIPQFLDFRNEAKAAALRQSMDAINTAVKLQLAQMRLRCNFDSQVNLMDFGTFFSAALTANDITAPATALGAGPIPRGFCTTDQIPNPADRRFFTDNMPTNPFADPSAVIIRTFSLSAACASALPNLQCCSSSLAQPSHWAYTRAINRIIPNIYPNTNTSGVTECGWTP